MQYLEYLGSEEWREISSKRKEKDNNVCVLCGKDSDLVVHHMFYPMKKGKRADTIKNLVTLCSKCHEKTHGLSSSDKRASNYEEIEATPKMIKGMNGALYRYGAISGIIPNYEDMSLLIVVGGVASTAGKFNSREQLVQELNNIEEWGRNKKSLFEIGPNISRYVYLSYRYESYKAIKARLDDTMKKFDRLTEMTPTNVKSDHRKVRKALVYCESIGITELRGLDDYNKVYCKYTYKKATNPTKVAEINSKLPKFREEYSKLENEVKQLKNQIQEYNPIDFDLYEKFIKKSEEI